MKRRDLERHLKQHGCALDREGVNHSWWAHAVTSLEQAAVTTIQTADNCTDVARV